MQQRANKRACEVHKAPCIGQPLVLPRDIFLIIDSVKENKFFVFSSYLDTYRTDEIRQLRLFMLSFLFDLEMDNDIKLKYNLLKTTGKPCPIFFPSMVVPDTLFPICLLLI